MRNIRPNGSDRDQSKKLSIGEYSQARSTAEPRSSRANKSSQPNKSTGSDHGQKFDAFLSHSGKQKNFVRQLHRDLTKRGVFCFFDEDHESLPVGEPFPPRILAAAKSCKLAVLLLSKEFLETKWPMLELSTVVKARDKYPNIKILPLFFKIAPEALKQIKADNEKWREFEESKEERAEWHRALRVIRGINGLKFTEGDNEVKFRDEIVKKVWHILSTDFPRYHVPCMQGELRMCQELSNFFNEVQPNKNGIRIVGLYGIAGYGKTTLGKAFCNFKLEEFEGKVCHVEFSRGDSLKKKEDALQHLTHCPQPYLDTLTSQDQAQIELYRRVKGQRVLLVLDNITDDSIDEVRDYLRADLGENSYILLSARSVDVLVKQFSIDSQSCMRVPRLEEEEAIAILLEKAFPGEPTLEAEERSFGLKCAKRCLFKETCCDIVPRARTYHPLALKAFGGYLFSKYGFDLSKWAAEMDGMVDRALDGLDEVFAVLGKAFDDMPAKYRTIFMLLTVYMLPNMSSHKVSRWLAINCNEEISFIEKAVEDLRKKAFIEEYKPEVRIHDLYIEFAQSKANEMGRWLWWKKEDDQCSTRGLIAEDNTGFELAKLEECMYRKIAPRYLGNLFVLQLVDVQNVSKLDLGPMDRLRSITLRDCKFLVALDGMEKLVDLAWLEIRGVNPMFELPEVSSFEGLQHLEIDIAGSQVLDQLGDLTRCFRLREINVLCPSLSKFPRLKGMKHLEKVEFSLCDKVKGPLDCRDCVKLQTIVLNLCCQMAASPLLTGCRKLSKLVLSECDALTACPEVDVPSALKTLDLFISSKAASAPKNLESFWELENLQLWNMGELVELPSFKRLSNLTVLKLGKCNMREPPDLTGCDKLEDVYFFTLTNLERFPNFSSLMELKKLSLCNCISVQDPPDIERCHQLQVFHLLYNDNMKGLPRMDKCAQLEEIKVSWHCQGEVTYEGIDPDNCRVEEDLEYCLEYWKDEKFGNISAVSLPEALKQWKWLKGKTKLAKRYFRGVKLYYSLTAPYESYKSSKCYSQSSIAPILVDWESSVLYSQRSLTLRLVNCKVIAFPDPTMGRAWQDYGWLNRVLKYFYGREDIARASAASVSSNIVEDISLLLPLSPRYGVPPMQGEARVCQVKQPC
ncbi:disease resistance protein Roq1-like [Cryptomeria japonica]|nr:disease resistance protein Roq1-like [Cryptomeria japonica]